MRNLEPASQLKLTRNSDCITCSRRVRESVDYESLISSRAFDKFPNFITGLADWKKGFTLTYRDKFLIDDDELQGVNTIDHCATMHGDFQKTEDWARWAPTLKWVKKTMEEWKTLQDYNGNKFIAILEKGKMGTERYHVHGISTGSIRHWGQGFHQEIDVSPAWVHYVSKYMLKEPLGFWSNI